MDKSNTKTSAIGLRFYFPNYLSKLCGLGFKLWAFQGNKCIDIMFALEQLCNSQWCETADKERPTLFHIYSWTQSLELICWSIKLQHEQKIKPWLKEEYWAEKVKLLFVSEKVFYEHKSVSKGVKQANHQFYKWTHLFTLYIKTHTLKIYFSVFSSSSKTIPEIIYFLVCFFGIFSQGR